MGVPKFFRYISERYPCLSELVKEYQIPEFDNLYLDMNGIIHMCSHPDDNNPHFRITEEKIFQDVFHYIEVLFRMIRPQKLFFMAVDGVAPRAKMNQQRGRRFRSAKDAEKQESDARKKGEKLPEVARFDSNCITPGTVFMARLHEQLKYFVVDKISHDPAWQNCKVILSGHETPGEGEHKIMDYIRYMRAQPGYDPNTRHCLYGLDADLIMLGLCTHEPHFSLLREEVKFGKKSTKRMSVPEEITFYLLHLSLMREYLELEFAPLTNKLQGFAYDFEKIIDDWVLMGFLVGNDFIPHLPNLHIANGALPVLYKAYMDILPTLDGYINESGSLNLARFEKFMEKLSNIDLENFEEIRDDLNYMESKTGKKWNAHTKVSTRNLEEWISEVNENISLDPLEPPKVRDSGIMALINETNDMYLESAEDAEEQTEEDDAFENYKKDYYKNKLEYANVTPQVMRDQAEGYVRAIQWNLNYYYNGCCSWSWFYPHHYAPYISDIKGFSNLKIEFDLGKPFLPYEQLLAVLPSASRNLLPSCYHYLMTDESSLIKEYYPEDFQTDLNGKKQEWEAVVLVPFIDENVLLEAMKSCNDKLTPAERKRNSHGPMLIYSYTPNDMGPYPAPEYFPPITHNHAEVMVLFYDEVFVPKEKLVKGAYPGVKMNVYYPGFPTMKHLKYKAELRKAKIKVFESPSRNENMIITIIPNEKYSGDKIPVDLLGTSVFVGWPHLIEAKVGAISNSQRKYVSVGNPGEYNIEERTGHLIPQFKQEVEGMTEFYQRRMGIECGETKVLVHVHVMMGQKYQFTPNGEVCLKKQFAEQVANYPLQTVVFNIASYDSHPTVFRDVQSIFPKGCICFTLTNPYYGSQGIVQESKEPMKNGRIKICISVVEEPDFTQVREIHAKVIRSYKTLYNAARQLSMTNLLFSRVTGSIFLTARNNEGGLKNVNVGLDLKFNKKNKETPGYTKKIGSTWYYTDRAVEVVRLYSEKYPEVFDYLSHDEKFDEINVESIFKDDWDEKLKELQNWLKSLPTCSVERQTCGSSALEPEVIEVVENIVDNRPTLNAKKVTMQIKPSFLYRAEIQTRTLAPDPNTVTEVLDRVVNVRNGFSVPLGLKGTVVAVQESTTGSNRDTMYDVVFDQPFKDGMKLNCSDNRGYKLPNTAFINISYGQRLLKQKTGKLDLNELISNANASHKNTSYNDSYKGPNNFMSNQYAQQWLPPQNEGREHVPYHSQQPFRQENSAFAQFTNITGQKQSYQQHNAVPPQGINNNASDKPVGQHNYNEQTKNQTVANNGAVNRVSPGFQRSDNNFMPTFGRDSNDTKPQTQQPAQKRPSNTQSKQDTNGKIPVETENLRPSINTDYLKSLLKIGNDKECKEDNKKILSDASTSQSVQKAEGEASQNLFEIFAQAAKAPASVRLLTYYQSNGLGLPRYQYFKSGNLISSQITLSNGIVVTGMPAKTKEEASENVATDVLEVFMSRAKTESSSTQLTEGFPIPPRTWVKPQTDSVQSQNNKDRSNSERKENVENQPITKNKTDVAVLNNSFVPLQAIKKHIGKSGSVTHKQAADENSSKENIATQQDGAAGSNGNGNKQKHQSASVQNQTEPKRERRTRIAANFVSKKN